jgi:hypothetical protein
MTRGLAGLPGGTSQISTTDGWDAIALGGAIRKGRARNAATRRATAKSVTLAITSSRSAQQWNVLEMFSWSIRLIQDESEARTSSTAT